MFAAEIRSADARTNGLLGKRLPGGLEKFAFNLGCTQAAAAAADIFLRDGIVFVPVKTKSPLKIVVKCCVKHTTRHKETQ